MKEEWGMQHKFISYQNKSAINIKMWKLSAFNQATPWKGAQLDLEI